MGTGGKKWSLILGPSTPQYTTSTFSNNTKLTKNINIVSFYLKESLDFTKAKSIKLKKILFGHSNSEHTLSLQRKADSKKVNMPGLGLATAQIIQIVIFLMTQLLQHSQEIGVFSCLLPFQTFTLSLYQHLD